MPQIDQGTPGGMYTWWEVHLEGCTLGEKYTCRGAYTWWDVHLVGSTPGGMCTWREVHLVEASTAHTCLLSPHTSVQPTPKSH